MAAPFDVSEHARIARRDSVQDYMSIPWNDDFGESFELSKFKEMLGIKKSFANSY